MSGSAVAFPGVGGGTITLSFNNAANAGLASQLAGALDLAQTNGTLDIVDYTGTSIPTVPSGHTQELVLASSVAGSITVPAAPSGTSQVLVVTNTAPITIHGSPGLRIIGGGTANIVVLDPASIVLADVGGTTNYTDLVSLPAADSPYIVGMRDGKETVYADGSGTIFSGLLGSTYINLTAAGAATSNVILSQGIGDTVLTGSGNTTVTSSGNKALILDGTGSFTDNDQGLQDTIAATDAASAAITTAGNQALVFGGADSISYLDTGSRDTMVAEGSALKVTTGGAGAYVWGAATSSFTGIDTGSHDTIIGSNAATTENLAGSSAVFAAMGGATSVVASGSGALIFGGAESLNYIDIGSNNTIVAEGGALNARTAGYGAVVWGGAAGSLMGLDTGNQDTIIGSNVVTTETLAGSSAAFAAEGGTTSVVASGNAALIFGGSGALSVNGSGSTNLTIAGGSGTEILNAGSASNLLVYGATGGLDFIGGSGHVASVIGEAASNTITGGDGGLVYAAGAEGNSTIVGASSIGGVTLFGGADAALTYVSSLMGATLVAGAGNETLNAAGSTKANIFWAGQTAADTALLTAGSGADTLIAGPGTDTLAGGGGGDLFAFISGRAGGVDVIANFNATDRIDLYGYGTAAASSALQGAVVSGGNTTLTLADSTTITFLGISSASTLSGHIFST